MALEPAKLSDFTMAGALGSGTTACVYEAVHNATGRVVAIKTMERSSSTSETRERFAREALLLAGVESRHVCKILGFGFDKGQPFLVLELLVGETLDAKLRRDGAVSPVVAAHWIEQLIVGVRDCHDAKIIHRDIKPSNMFLERDPRDPIRENVKLIDFGVARLREITSGATGLTSTNHLIGSMGYMAPEQYGGAQSVSYSADLYAVGVVIFRMLTGRLPFVSRSIQTVFRMKSEQAAPKISAMGGPQNVHLDAFVDKAMHRVREARFQTAREMLEQWWSVVPTLQGEGTAVLGGAEGPLLRSTVPGPVPTDASDPHTDTTLAEAGGPPVPLSHELATVSAGESAGHPADDRDDKTVVQRPAWLDVDEAPEPPTRTDPTLREIVERELELHRKRKEQS